jgi:putative ABC transport system permease protein
MGGWKNMNQEKLPPKWAIRFFQWFCNDHLSEAVLGDLLHLYERRLKSNSKRKADLLFLWNVIQFIQPFALKNRRQSSNINIITMYRSYFKIAWRNMAAQKMYTLIKIGGFALGLSTCIVIALFIQHELSYDKQYQDGKNIYRVYNEMKEGKWTAFPAPFTGLLKENFPEIELAARLLPYNWYNAGNNLVRVEDQTENIYEEGFAYADPELLEILEMPMAYGNRKTALNAPNTIVMTKRKADKFFPDQDPVGKTIVLNNDPNTRYTIGGVIEDFLPTSHLQFDFYLTLKEKEFWEGEQTNWCCWNYNPYIKVKDGTDPAELEKKILAIKKVYVEYLMKEKSQFLEDEKKYHIFRLQPVKDIHLYSEGIGDIIPHGDIRYIWMFGGIAIFILLLACINFINLSTARSANRAREVGLRKVVGSYRSSLVHQFLGESILYSLISFVLALIILAIGLPYFNELAGKTIVVPWSAWWFFPVLALAALIVGVLAGLYPSFYLSSFKPIDVLKGSIARGMKNSTTRSAMVVFQFTTSIVLIIGTAVIYKQMNFMLTAKIGYDKEQIIMVHGANTLDKQQQSFKDELLKLADVRNVTISKYLPVEGTTRDQNLFWREGKVQEEKGIGAQAWWVDEDYMNTMGMKLVAGRGFQKAIASDSNAVIVNQSLVKEFGFENPIGQRIVNWRPWNIIGVVEDFNYDNMKGKIRPLVFLPGDNGSIASIKLSTSDMQSAIESISAVWKKFMPHQAIRYSFLDERYARMYDDVRRMGNIFASFATLAIIVACLGLFALSAFMVEQRNKEISIRLVLGASLQNIFRLLTDQFIRLVIISFVLAVPLSWYMMNVWLEDYEYKIKMGWEVFVMSGLLSVIIALLTVSYQSIRAALANPANSLRSE